VLSRVDTVVGIKVLSFNWFKATKVNVPGKVATIEYDPIAMQESL
jgi:hypothetical protein